jgi:MFS transporter, Spinster family, sphingosine-1-phosphate transporter
MLGGAIAARWGWQTAFGVLGIPGLILAVAYLKVRDYPTVQLTPALDRATRSTGEVAMHIVRALGRSPSMLWVCIGGAAQLVVVSAVWSWLPSFLNRVHGIAPDRAAVGAALIVLGGAVGSVLWGTVVDRFGVRRPARKLHAMAMLCLLSLLLLVAAFGLHAWYPAAPAALQLALVAAGGFVMTCTVGPVSAVVIDVVHPGVRATGASVLALFQNLFGLAAGPFIVGMLSDAWGLTPALAATPAFGAVAALAFMRARHSYAGDRDRAAEPPAPSSERPSAPATAVA